MQAAAGNERGEAHPHVQCDPGLLGQDLDPAEPRDRGQHGVEGSPDLPGGVLEMPVQVSGRSAHGT